MACSRVNFTFTLPCSNWCTDLPELGIGQPNRKLPGVFPTSTNPNASTWKQIFSLPLLRSRFSYSHTVTSENGWRGLKMQLLHLDRQQRSRQWLANRYIRYPEPTSNGDRTAEHYNIECNSKTAPGVHYFGGKKNMKWYQDKECVACKTKPWCQVINTSLFLFAKPLVQISVSTLHCLVFVPLRASSQSQLLHYMWVFGIP